MSEPDPPPPTSTLQEEMAASVRTLLLPPPPPPHLSERMINERLLLLKERFQLRCFLISAESPSHPRSVNKLLVARSKVAANTSLSPDDEEREGTRLGFYLFTLLNSYLLFGVDMFYLFRHI